MVHIVRPTLATPPYGFAFTSLENPAVQFVGAGCERDKENEKDQEEEKKASEQPRGLGAVNQE